MLSLMWVSMWISLFCAQSVVKSSSVTLVTLNKGLSLGTSSRVGWIDFFFRYISWKICFSLSYPTWWDPSLGTGIVRTNLDTEFYVPTGVGSTVRLSRFRAEYTTMDKVVNILCVCVYTLDYEYESHEVSFIILIYWRLSSVCSV